MTQLRYKKIAEFHEFLKQSDNKKSTAALKNLQEGQQSNAELAIVQALCEKYNYVLKKIISLTHPQENISLTSEKNQKLSRLNITPLLGISIVSCCINNNNKFKKGLESWLKLPVQEIIIVDWSSLVPISETLENINDSRIRIIRIENELKWIPTYAFNVGLRIAKYNKIYKLNAGTEVTSSFLTKNNFNETEFVRENKEPALNTNDCNLFYINSSFGCYKKHLAKIGYYNEFIQAYEWGDSDVYSRLARICGLRGKHLSSNSIINKEESKNRHLASQPTNRNMFLDYFEEIEYYKMKKKYQAILADEWDGRLLSDYKMKFIQAGVELFQRVTNEISIPHHVIQDAEKYAILSLMRMVNPDMSALLHKHNELIQQIKDHFYQGVPFIYTTLLIHEKSANKKLPKGNVLSGNLHHFITDHEFNAEYMVSLGLPCSFKVECNGKTFWLVSTNNNENIEISRKNSIKSNWKVFVTSVYDEKNNDRLNEYIYCIQENCKNFDSIVLFYEKSTEILYNRLQFKLKKTEYWKKIIFISYEKRPTFEFLFNTSDKLFPNAIIFVSNADIATDTSIQLINSNSLNKSFFTISRNEVDQKNKKSTGLLLNKFGIPNTFSADMWVYQAPRKHLFKADFPIGTYHCDSFLNYYINKSKYELYNPCLDVNLYHIHNPKFNSSEEKAIKKKIEINKTLQTETEINNGEQPLKGARWGRLLNYNSKTSPTGCVNWYNTLIKIELSSDGSNLIQVFSTALIALETLNYMNFPASIWLMLPNTKSSDFVYLAASDFIEKLNSPHLYLGIKGNYVSTERASFNAHKIIGPSVLIKTITNLRKRNISTIWGSVEKASIEGDFFGLKHDPNLIATCYLKNNDSCSISLLNVLSATQLKFLKDYYGSMLFKGKYKEFKVNIQHFLNN